jgi:ATP-dependent RNA helicase RhlE
MLFRDLNLNPTILDALIAKGYESATPIQAGAIPPVLAGRDVWGCAQTGTGKTAAFALPILNNLASKPFVKTGAVRALILSPTRELALQIGEQFTAYGKGLKLRVATIFGGVSDFQQKQKLRQGVEILVATPGRLMDLLGQRALTLDHVEIFTLDEADRMMDMGFIHDVRRISALLPDNRQTLLFSATMPPEIKTLAKNLLRDPVNVEVTPVSSTVSKIEQSVYHVSRNLKPALLRELLADPALTRALVFTRTKHGADKVVRALEKGSVFAEAIHGNKTQGARQRALTNFKSGRTRVLVATDIASRGIDVTDISHVFNYDLPEVPETYVHRIGRTARNGASGTAVAFCDGEERAYLKQIERTTRQVLPVVAVPELKSLPTDNMRLEQRDPSESDGRRGDSERRPYNDRFPRSTGSTERSDRPRTYGNPASESQGQGRGPAPRYSREEGSVSGRSSSQGARFAPAGNRAGGRPEGGRTEYKPFWKRAAGAPSDRRRPSQESSRA